MIGPCSGGAGQDSEQDNIWQFDSEAGQWTELGRLQTARRDHAVSVVNFYEVEPFCPNGVTN